MDTETLTRTVLNVGCGKKNREQRPCHWSFPRDEWREIRLDIDERNAPDIVAPMTDLSAVETASVDAVFVGHALEHIYGYEVPIALGEFFRVLKQGGGFLTHMPDLQQACAAVAEGRGEQYLYQSPGGAIAAMDMIFGYRKMLPHAPAMGHKTGFTKDSLRKLMEAAGFEAVETWTEQWDLWGVGYKT